MGSHREGIWSTTLFTIEAVLVTIQIENTQPYIFGVIKGIIHVTR